MHQVNVSRHASKSSGEPHALTVPRLLSRKSGESPTLQQHVQFKVVDASTITDARCSKVSLPLQRFFGDRLLNHSYCDGVVPTLEGALWMGGWHEPQVVYSILKPMRATGAFIDIGANAGLFSLVALSGNYSQVLSFEPQPGCADEMLFTHTYNGAPARWRIYNVGVGKTHQAFQVPGEGCGMNWQKTGKGRSWVAQGIPLSMIVSAMDQAGPAYLKIDCDGAEVSVVEAVLDLLPGKETNGFAYLPEMYVEVNPLDWRSFGKSAAQGLNVFRSLGSRYTEIYFFSAMTSSCEGIGLVSDAGHNLTEPYLFVSENHPPPGMARWVGRFSRPQWILRVKDYDGLLNRCVTHTRQLNLWFAK
jgi:FkbM family methyltransferase